MKTKVIGIGSRIMKDDGIGDLIAEGLKDDLEKQGIQVVVGETDIDYCLSFIEDGDFLFIIDATLYGLEPGSLTVMELNGVKGTFNKGYSQHQLSLVKLLNSYSIKKVKGYVIGVEVVDVDFGVELSPIIKEKFEKVKENIYNFIILRKEHKNA